MIIVRILIGLCEVYILLLVCCYGQGGLVYCDSWGRKELDTTK